MTFLVSKTPRKHVDTDPTHIKMPRDIHHKLPEPLTEELGINPQHALENFQLKLILSLEDDERFSNIIQNQTEWTPTSSDPNRGFVDILKPDKVTIDVSAAQQCRVLQLMLDTIASVIPVISKTFITHQATSLNCIWKRLRVHYGLRKSGGTILNIGEYLRKKPQESNEAYWERCYSFIEDNLLSPIESITHFGKQPTKNEAFTPTLHNLLVSLWLYGINPNLPSTAKLKFAPELRDKTAASLREEISEAIPSILQEHGQGEEIMVARMNYSTNRPQGNQKNFSRKTCSLCYVSGKMPNDHFLSECPFLLKHDKIFMQNRDRVKTRYVDIDENCDQDDDGRTEIQPEHNLENSSVMVRKVDIEGSPVLTANYGSNIVKIVLDYGTTGDMISLDLAKKLHLPISSTNQRANMADGGTPMNVVGETHVVFTLGHHQLKFNALVATNVSGDILGGVPFHRTNDIHVRIKTKTIMIGSCCKQVYKPYEMHATHQARTVAILKNKNRATILPKESIKLPIPDDFKEENLLAVEPRAEWLHPEITTVEDGFITLTNKTLLPVSVGNSEQVCSIRRTETFLIEDMECQTIPSVDHVKSIHQPDNLSDSSSGDCVSRSILKPTSSVLRRGGHSDLPIENGIYYSESIDIFPKLPIDIIHKFKVVNRKYDDVFNPAIGCYNGASGQFEARVNMGPTLPPQRKGHCPQYCHTNKQLLQEKMDYLDSYEVLAKPSDLGITIEYVNPSFLVKKPSGDWRTVTSFGEIAKYCKPQPALMSRCDDTIRHIGRWTYIITTDLSKAYRQIPLSRDSYKYCGTCTPFKGVRCYKRCAMGMPGSETALEDLMCLVLGDLIAEGHVAKVADDLYCGANSLEEIVEIWSKVLERLAKNGLRLSPAKTKICPTSTTILGWQWTNGTLSASTHRLSALQFCSPPETVKALRSFIGAYKFISKVLPNHCDVLHPLESTLGSRDSREKIEWTDELSHAFSAAQKHLSNAKVIHLPRPNDQLQIVTDAATSKLGLAATLYAIRKGKPLICGFFNAKMTDNQTRWLPCESEALGIHLAVSFFAPYIIESKHRVTVFTDSKPCVQAYQKILRGEFSNSPRVMTFISTLSNYGIQLLHVKGSDNLLADFTSRNTIECNSASCQICKFTHESEHSVVREVDVTDVAKLTSIDPFLNRAAWHGIQKSCPDLQRVHSQLRQGTRPSRKFTKLRDVRAYLRNVVVARDGLLVVPITTAFAQQKELIVIPRSVAHGVVTALHLRLSHASAHELQKVIKRNFFFLNKDEIIRRVTRNCEVCASLKTVPKIFKEQSTSVPPDTLGRNFSTDVVRRCKQKILVLREDTSAFTRAMIIPNESKDTLRDGLLELASYFRSMNAPPIKIRTDPAPGFRSLVTPTLDPLLAQNGLSIEMGDEKNMNKNPIAERCISEVHFQLTKLQPGGGPISSSTLARAISNLNSHLRESGLSSLEIWTQRDQITGEQLPISDRNIIRDRYEQRLRSHKSSAKYSSRGKSEPKYPSVNVGDLIYLIQDRDKTKARDRYLVIAVEHPKCTVQKFCGSQLRSRAYRVDMADCVVLKSIPQTLDLKSNSDSDDSDSESNHSENNSDIDSDHPNDSDGDQNSDDDVVVDSDPDGQPPANAPIFGVGHRVRRRPVILNDYVSDFSSDDDD